MFVLLLPHIKTSNNLYGKNDENRYIIDLFLQEHLYLFRELFSHNLRVDLTAHVVYIYLRAYTQPSSFILYLSNTRPPPPPLGHHRTRIVWGLHIYNIYNIFTHTQYSVAHFVRFCLFFERKIQKSVYLLVSSRNVGGIATTVQCGNL